MPRLNRTNLIHVSAGTATPAYDRSQVREGIVHIGVGGFHRAHQAAYLDTLLARDAGAADFGICGVSLLPQDRRIVEVMNEQDTLYTLLVRAPDGRQHPRVVGSIIEHLYAPDQPELVLARMSDPAVRVVSMTITEGGYFYRPADDAIDIEAPELVHDALHPDAPQTAFGYIVAALRLRRAAGVAPFTVMSCDNVQANGQVTRRVVTALAARQDRDLGAWVTENVAFPSSMVDRITPRTSDDDRVEVERLTGLADGWPVVCESFTQWVIEDQFPTGRPSWELVGAQFVDDVGPYEAMKLRLLNAGHLTIGYTGRLLGHTLGNQAATDPTIRRLLQGYQAEAAATMSDLPGTDLAAYSATVVERFSHPQVADSIARLTSSASTTLPLHLLPVIRDLLDEGHEARCAIAVVAAWARFLEGVDDLGRTYQVQDPRAAELQARAAHHGRDLLSVVRANPMFDGLAGRPEFDRPYARTLAALRTAGTRSALDALI
jgi:mannitol 2-dehydrogenase